MREETVEGRARRYYALTGDGEAALRAEAVRLAEAAKVVTRVPVVRRGVVRPA